MNSAPVPVRAGHGKVRFMGLAVLAMLAACGPEASHDPAVPPASVTRAARAQLGAPAEHSLETLASSVASPSMTASVPKPVVPAWMAKELDSPDVRVRLRALDRWAQQGRRGSVDPLMLALNDADEQVRARALQLIEQDWMAEQAAQPKQSP